MNGICNVSLRVERGYIITGAGSCLKPDAAVENTKSRNLKKAYMDFIHWLDRDFPTASSSLAFRPLFLQFALCASVSAH